MGFITWNIYLKQNLVHSMSWERCVAVRTQEVTFDSQLKSHTGEPFNFQATSLNCLCCCSSTFIVRTWLNRAGGAWRARGARGSLQFLATIESKHMFKKPTIIWRSLPLYLEFTKSQLILKCLFSVFDFSQKTNENNSTWGIIVVKSNFFVRFLRELRMPKSPFEINWP